MKVLSHHLVFWILSCGTAATLLFITATTAIADDLEYNIFLPIIAQRQDEATDKLFFIPTFNPALDFNLDPHPGLTRLQHLNENGGSLLTGELSCGTQNQLEVYRVNSKLTGPLTVRVIHTDDAGNQWQELRQIIDQHGARFPLYERATVQLVPDAAHRRLTSSVITVSTDLKQIPFDRLIRSGYCSDDATCQQLVDADVCHGSVSWNVVFTGKK